MADAAVDGSVVVRPLTGGEGRLGERTDGRRAVSDDDRVTTGRANEGGMAEAAMRLAAVRGIC